MVFYFSGTGNSQLAAKQIASELRDEPVSINQYLKEGKRATFHSETPLVFVTPNYAWRMPEIVEQWIRENKFTGNQNAYFVMNGGTSLMANAAFYSKKLCRDTGLIWRGHAAVRMPKNNLALYGAFAPNECEAIIAQAKPIFSALAKQIRRGESFREDSASLSSRFLSGPFHALYYRFYITDKGFRVSDGCVSCGRCAKRCPLNNIDLTDGKPVWKGNCTHCMACLCGCPTEAIDFRWVSKGKRRYYIMEE